MKAKILQALRETDGYVSGQQLCEQFQVSRTAVWKAINQLREMGYDIDSVSNKGYCIRSAPDLLNKNELMSLRKTAWIGQRLECFDVIGSTNTTAMQMAEEGAPNGTLVVADRQDSGKGRRGRGWVMPAGIAIAMSIVIKPEELQPGNAPMLTLVSALAVMRAIEEQTGLQPGIKWPNDIVINGKKVCGMLTEMSTQIDYINHIVVGIGINVHNEQFPEELSDRATSLYLESGKHYSRAALVEAVCEYFEHYYEIFMRTQDLSGLKTEYDSFLVNKDRQVRILDPLGEYEGTALGITLRGELLVETPEGVRTVDSGEVSVRGIYGYV
ncbi:MAG: biotin--[acetyl-CoA-carboxylase] ligase [Lachnospiraceae bacterium]|nr:biotin--[acetyl-CoA-carboxylase] ligase [bacterium]MDY5516150.1 biotin--[acetyl-CoA-carboxylase] ligase [Lachnospiraceae bacterium]